jgi:hypothetical protein
VSCSSFRVYGLGFMVMGSHFAIERPLAQGKKPDQVSKQDTRSRVLPWASERVPCNVHRAQLSLCLTTYIYIYVCVCVCVCV